jgi:hypothetical protein
MRRHHHEGVVLNNLDMGTLHRRPAHLLWTYGAGYFHRHLRRAG